MSCKLSNDRCCYATSSSKSGDYFSLLFLRVSQLQHFRTISPIQSPQSQALDFVQLN